MAILAEGPNNLKGIKYQFSLSQSLGSLSNDDGDA